MNQQDDQWICRNFGSSLAASLETLVHRRNLARLSLLYVIMNVHLNWLNWIYFLILEKYLLVILIKLHDFSVTIQKCHNDVYVNSFFPCTARFWNFFAIKCFPLIYDLNSFKSRIKRHLSVVGSIYADFMYALIFLCFFFLQLIV